VKKALSRPFQEPKIPGQYPARSSEIKTEILEWIAKNAQKHNEVTKSGILHDGVDDFATAVTRDSADSFAVEH
jgi:hypothetical protein